MAQNIDESQLIGKWKLKSFDTIEMIRMSPGYQSVPENTRKEMYQHIDKQLITPSTISPARTVWCIQT
ncbi:hypothetical protein FKX85_16875 [Echinicola soli]|uniref:Lipocalin-like domain-containing protein n=1 Tax=Echinicola soli TaxID=2591634 RepID=A0A514CLC2_9BACT|nr:hypothetical protein [Echinicola soli]QDH80623.1 hypothetical protein FKX85_16875 [Echinicola soli]